MECSKINNRIVLAIVILGIGQRAQSQGIKEWFSQKQTQRQYLAQQIAALKVYSGYLQKGYSIVTNGLHTISSITDGHWNLDKVFFDGQNIVSQKIKTSEQAKKIISLQMQTLTLMNATVKMMRTTGLFQSSDLTHVQKVFSQIKKGYEGLTLEMENLLNDNIYKMGDAERIKRIDAIYKQTQERSEFIQSFCLQLKKLELQKQLELKDIQVMKRLNP